MAGVEAAHSGFAEVNGGRLYYEVAGQGHPLVLSHEGICDHKMYDDQFAVFARQYRTIRYDLRGFGQSTVPTAPFSFSEDLAELLRVLGVARAHVLGMSMGGTASINLALSYPAMVTALVLAGSGLDGFAAPNGGDDPLRDEFMAAEAANDLQRLAELAVRRWVVGEGRETEQVDPLVRQRVAEMERHNLSREADEDFMRHLEPPAVGRLGAIQAPTLVIIGDRDVAYIRQVADMLTSDIAGARKVVMHDTAHVPNMEQPEAFNQLVLDFLAGI